MRLHQAMIVAKKDLAEFRKNRYILLTIVLMPLFISIILPLVYVIPINQLSRQSQTELDLTFEITVEFTSLTIANASVSNARLTNVDVINCIVIGSIIENSTIENTNLVRSRISDSSVEDSMMTECELIDLTHEDGNVVTRSEYVGGSDELKALQDLMLNVLLIMLVITPVTIPTVTASYSFVGEKVNKSLEPLLATPTTDIELLVGKSGSIFAVSMAATWLSFAVATVMVDILTYPVLGYYLLPNSYWVIGILLLAPGMCLMSILANVIISSRVNDVRVSQQIGGIVILPILIFFFFTLAGVLTTALLPMIVFSVGVVIVDALILWVSLRVFNREEILVSWK